TDEYPTGTYPIWPPGHPEQRTKFTSNTMPKDRGRAASVPPDGPVCSVSGSGMRSLGAVACFVPMRQVRLCCASCSWQHSVTGPVGPAGRRSKD
ncbi:hypothetical protein, partial [Kitasatospora nipponensis]|uniref:hypothetical protein n=1 Tax=Kitasatospora nipponensis TaxID=258049 RepID=UPI0031DAFF64